MTSSTSSVLADCLFVSQEQWGWGYVPPAPIARSPEFDQMPTWQEPPEPDVGVLREKVVLARRKLFRKLAITTVVWFVLSSKSLPSGRRVVIGDCNPDNTLLDRVELSPRS